MHSVKTPMFALHVLEVCASCSLVVLYEAQRFVSSGELDAMYRELIVEASYDAGLVMSDAVALFCGFSC